MSASATDLSNDPDFQQAFRLSANSDTSLAASNLAEDPDFSGMLRGSGQVPGLIPESDSTSQRLLSEINAAPKTSSLDGNDAQIGTNLALDAIFPEAGLGSYALNALMRAGAFGAANAPFGYMNNPQNPLTGAAMQGALGAGTGAVSALLPLASYASPTKIAGMVQDTHDFLSAKAANAFDTVSQEAANRGISQVPINNSLLAQVRPRFPNTDATNALFNDASTGDYNALRDLQSSIWQRATKRMASDFPEVNNEGEEMFDVRDKINDAISNHFINTGNSDLAGMLDGATNDYRNLKQTYYSQPTIAKMVDPATRKVPNNITSTLGENSVQMNAVRAANPAVANALNIRNAQGILGTTGKILGLGSPIVGGGIALYKHYMD